MSRLNALNPQGNRIWRSFASNRQVHLTAERAEGAVSRGTARRALTLQLLEIRD